MFLSLLFSAGMLLLPDYEPLDAVTVTADRGVVVSRTDSIQLSNTSDLA